jgi:urease accessory protein
MGTITIMSMDDFSWLPSLLIWMSPAYPVGAYAYSHGLEWAVEAGAVTTRAEVEAYILTALEAGGGWSDLVLLAASWRAAGSGDRAALDEIAEQAAAWRGTAETALESREQGAAFVRATMAAWPGTPLDDLAARRGGTIAYPVAVGAASVATPLNAVVLAYGLSFASNLVSAAIRLVPLGQSDGQIALARLAPAVARTAEKAARTPLTALATAAPGIDLASMRHETQYTRLFRS